MLRAPVGESMARLCLTFLDSVNTYAHNRPQKIVGGSVGGSVGDGVGGVGAAVPPMGGRLW